MTTFLIITLASLLITYIIFAITTMVEFNRIESLEERINKRQKENEELNEKLDRLIDFLGLEEKEEEFIDKWGFHDEDWIWIEKSSIKVKKYFVKRKK